MKIKDSKIYNQAARIIKDLYGEHATFRDGQYEAIESTLTNKRSLVVQKTGWGKSLVYFACTKILRQQNKGLTIVVSPLLVLMENQIESAKKLGLNCEVLNSTVNDRRQEIIGEILNDHLDLLLVTPETLFREDIQNNLKDFKIGLFVIDEAHCISDWGHDFRLDYSNLNKVIALLPMNVPVLATTATANNRVIQDLKNQLGKEVHISRGPLTRESLAIQVLKLKNKAERYAWILENINTINGSGIIYCLTQRDCDYLADFLNKNGIEARPYYSRDKENEYKNLETEELFKENKIKVIVATIKLGMGYDKGDIGFVIHLQQPSNVVSYYQQIGRAGRNIDHAYAFLMCGQEDHEINDYFINTAFPDEKNTDKIIELLENNNGLSVNELNSQLNLKRSAIDKALMFLTNDGFLYKERAKYYLTPKKYVYNKEHYEKITAIRKEEQKQMMGFIKTDDCYSKYVVNCLDDFTAKDCGICSNCKGKEIISSKVADQYVKIALEYMKNIIMDIEPRKMWALTKYTRGTKIPFINEIGICLSRYGDVGYGELVKEGKYAGSNSFSEELVGKSAKILNEIIKKDNIQYITCVPSLRTGIVDDFTKRVANSCGIKFIKVLSKKRAPQQKDMQNSSYQCQNAFESFDIQEEIEIPGKIILVDDVVDSKWTLTVCGYRLMENGCQKVYPFALADSSQNGDG